MSLSISDAPCKAHIVAEFGTGFLIMLNMYILAAGYSKYSQFSLNLISGGQ